MPTRRSWAWGRGIGTVTRYGPTDWFRDGFDYDELVRRLLAQVVRWLAGMEVA
jgi:hypothetical protein